MDPARWTWLDPEGLEVLTREQCRDLLTSVPMARVAFWADDGPTVLPVNHVIDAWTAAFRTGYGSKLSAAVRGQVVAVQADHFDEQARTGWSVLARGPAEHVTDETIIRRLSSFDLEPWADAVERPRWIRVPLEDLSGRRITRSEEGVDWDAREGGVVE